MFTDKPDSQCQCTENVTPEELRRRLDEVIAEYKGKPGGLIPVLQIAQGLYGYLPDEVIRHISLGLDKPYSEVAGVITFYSFFSTRPRGEHMVRVCLGTACYVRGGKQVLDAFKKELGVDVGETTPDRKYTLEVARCFGACGLAPAITVDEDVHQRVKPTKIREILSKYSQPAAAAKGA
jgi:NADH:ubiquinone oxidoreductase subunit E